MFRKISKGILSCLTIFLLLAGMTITGKITIKADAAETAFKVKIADVERLYTDSKKLLDLINEYRDECRRDPIVMDKSYLEAAMVRAAELSVYASEYCPDGESGLSRLGSVSGGQIIAYDVRSLYALINSFKENSESNYIMISSNYKSIGIGVVRVNGYKFVCILASGKSPSRVSDSELERKYELDQEISTLSDPISDMSPAYSDETGVSCGSKIPAYVKVRNQRYPDVKVYLTSYNASVSLSHSNVFKHEDGYLVALDPGTCQVKIAYPGSSSLNVSFSLKSVGKSFSSCDFQTIPDQLYTGSPIRPAVVITDSSGARLEKDKDYKISYKNNVEVGTATVTITGAGQYGGQDKDLYFRILENQDLTKSFSVSAQSSVSELLANSSLTISVTKIGGTSPYRFTYQYAPYGTSNWSTIQAGTSSTMCRFTPTSSGRYYLRVNGVDAKGLNASQTVTVKVYDAMTLNASLSATTVNVNDSVKITASGKGGKAPFEYGFYVQKPSSSDWVTIKSYSESNTASFTPKAEGKYSICVKLKGAVGETVKKYITLTVNKRPMKNTSTVSSKEIDLGQTVTIRGKSENGSSVTYAYYYKSVSEENWHAISNYTTTTSVTFKPSNAGSYDIYVKAKDSSGYIAKVNFVVKVHKALVNTSKISSGVIDLGKSVTFTCSAINGSGSYQYALYCRKGSESSYRLLMDYTTNTSYTFKPDAKGNYYFKLKVKDSIGYIASKEFSLKAQVPLTMNASVSSSSIKSGQTVTVNASATGGTSPYKMAVFYKKPGSSSFIRYSDYESSKTKTMTLSTKGTFTIRVKVKDSADNIVSQDLNVIVS